ncbi:dicarboxylate/amino acid:cation symporter [Secundilactobacillus paracollinoides]|uniref:dicarboxylate/amino acid:cation symporter n=1 Tax=Secundilactobacillus paracollinoides TaxID=240427 RepID=UPI0006D0EC7C|nr:dicarboxylate/amino acid:cation symporter [Secundilactobacillus paracollinoides]KRL75061.1 sodium dicarboxylate symporter [Secundilactobacillus paracollinoides DSM 15502 = JCM 11969]
MHKVSLTTQITIGMLVGAIAGMLFGKNVSGVTVVGDIFLRLIQMAVVLLIFGAVIEALGSLNPRDLGRLGAKTGLWFLMTTLLAALVGLGTGLLFKPGLSVHLDQLRKTPVHLNTPTNISQTILNFFPTNIFDALAKGNVIQVIIFAILFGLVLSQANKDGKFSQVLTLVKQTNQLTVKLVMLIMKAAPLGIAALIAGVVADNGSQVFLPLLTFLLIYGLATAVFLIALFCVISWVAKVPLIGLVHGFTQMIMVAFTTTSSAVALPVEMSDAQSKLGVSKPISQLVLPLGMALNSNGLAMYLSLVCVMLTQLYGIRVTPIALVQIVLLSVLSCLGTVVVPGGGLVALTIIVPTLGLPLSSIALFAGIDWFSGMFRTVTNVVGDTTTAIALATGEDELDRAVYHSDKVSVKH